MATPESKPPPSHDTEMIENAANRPSNLDSAEDDAKSGEKNYGSQLDLQEYSPEGEKLYSLIVVRLHVLTWYYLERSAVRRKIDWRIMPLAAWACGLQFVDKVSDNYHHQTMNSAH